MLERLSKETLHEGASKLGMLEGKTIVFNTEDESSLLMDYCLYDVKRGGRNAVEQYLIDSPPAADSDEMICLQAMQRAKYSVFVVESVQQGLGVSVRDLISDETQVMVDMGFSDTANPGLLFASRLLFHDGFTMSGGAAIPISVVPPDKINTLSKDLVAAMEHNQGNAPDPAPLIRACIQRGCASHIQYQDITGNRVERKRRDKPQQLAQRGHRDRQSVASTSEHETKIGRNSPCPCGSGKKFKQCCLRHS
jgi:hypothetical protein